MEIDKNILCEELSGNDEDHTIKNISYEMIPLEQAYSSFEAGRMEGESVKWNEASGRISLEYVYLYPNDCSRRENYFYYCAKDGKI